MAGGLWASAEAVSGFWLGTACLRARLGWRFRVCECLQSRDREGVVVHFNHNMRGVAYRWASSASSVFEAAGALDRAACALLLISAMDSRD